MRRFAVLATAAVAVGLLATGCSSTDEAQQTTENANAAVCLSLEGLAATVEGLFPVLFLWPVLAAARVGLTASGGWTASVAASLLMGLGGIGLISLLIAADPTCTANWPKGCMGLVFARGLIVEAYLPVVFACLALGGLMRVVRVRLGHLRR